MPTTTIIGTTDIEDTFCPDFNKNANCGGVTSIASDSRGDGDVGLMRILTSAIPEHDSISRFEWFWYISTLNHQDGSAYLVSAGNDWVEGSSTYATEAGAACWNYAKHNTQQWNGGLSGCLTAGTDYETDASPPTWFIENPADNTVLYSVELKTSWAEDWKSGDVENNGFAIIGNGVHPFGITIRSSEYTDNPDYVPYFEIDYTEPPPPLPDNGGKLVLRLR